MKPQNIEDCIERYGPISLDPKGMLTWANSKNWLVPCIVPKDITLRNYLGKTVSAIYVNKDIRAALEQAFANLTISRCQKELETFDGCFNPRWVRGMPGIPSFHSWGIAIDFNAAKNPLGGKSAWSENFVTAFELAGFQWGGDFKNRPDPMHFQWLDMVK